MEKNKKALVAPECLSVTSSSVSDSVSNKLINNNNYNNKLFTDVQADLEEELKTRFQPKKARSEELAYIYSDISLNAEYDRFSDDSEAIADKYIKKAFKVQNCGSFLGFQVSPTNSKLFHANFCKDRLCPMCNWRRSLKTFSQLSSVILALKGSPKYSSCKYLFATFTIRNVEHDELSSALHELLSVGWRNLYLHKLIKNESIVGSFRTLEITYNKNTKTFHPHLHVIFAVLPSYFKGGNYISQKQWSSIWADSMKLDYVPVVHIQTVKKIYDSISGSFDLGGIMEVSKYAAKDSDYLFSSDVTFALSEALAGRRLIGYTGCFNEIKKLLNLDDSEDGDLVHTSTVEDQDLAYVIRYYHWQNGFYVLEK